MKAILALLLLLTCLTGFSQSVSSGYITFNSGSTIYFKNLKIQGDDVKYFHEATQKEMTFPKGAVKKIVDNTGVVIYDASLSQTPGVVKNVPVVRNKSEEERLVYKSSNKVMLNQRIVSKEEIERLLKPTGVYETYKAGKSDAKIGEVLIGGGVGLFIGGAISNLFIANNTNASYNGKEGKKGGPAILVAGIAAVVIGIPVKISGNRKIKNALKQYNSLPAANNVSVSKSELKVIAGADGLGFQFKF